MVKSCSFGSFWKTVAIYYNNFFYLSRQKKKKKLFLFYTDYNVRENTRFSASATRLRTRKRHAIHRGGNACADARNPPHPLIHPPARSVAHRVVRFFFFFSPCSFRVFGFFFLAFLFLARVTAVGARGGARGARTGGAAAGRALGGTFARSGRAAAGGGVAGAGHDVDGELVRVV